MVQYATAVELAGYLQQDIDTYTATLILTTASSLFSNEADTMFAATTVTYEKVGDGSRILVLPFKPVTAISAVRIAGVAVTDYTRIRSTLYRTTGFGNGWAFPPEKVEVDLTHGYATVPDDVKIAVLETAAQAYTTPVGAVISEKIDDYAVRYATEGGGIRLTDSAMALAAGYRGQFLA